MPRVFVEVALDEKSSPLHHQYAHWLRGWNAKIQKLQDRAGTRELSTEEKYALADYQRHALAIILNILKPQISTKGHPDDRIGRKFLPVSQDHGPETELTDGVIDERPPVVRVCFDIDNFWLIKHRIGDKRIDVSKCDNRVDYCLIDPKRSITSANLREIEFFRFPALKTTSHSAAGTSAPVALPPPVPAVTTPATPATPRQSRCSTISNFVRWLFSNQPATPPAAATLPPPTVAPMAATSSSSRSHTPTLRAH
jgi:hypothetical protein